MPRWGYQTNMQKMQPKQIESQNAKKPAFRPAAGRNGGARTAACHMPTHVFRLWAETLVSAGREPTVYYLWNFLIPRIIFRITAKK